VRDDENLDLIFTVREPRCVSHSLTLQYDKTIYLLPDTPHTRSLIGKYIQVSNYPDGRIELRANGAALPYTTYDRLPKIDQGAIVENKRLGHVLQIAQLVQEQRDSRRSRSVPSRANQGQGAIQLKPGPGEKAQRKLDESDLAVAIAQTQSTKVIAPAKNEGCEELRNLSEQVFGCRGCVNF
jgi:hypothetical protein